MNREMGRSTEHLTRENDCTIYCNNNKIRGQSDVRNIELIRKTGYSNRFAVLDLEKKTVKIGTDLIQTRGITNV